MSYWCAYIFLISIWPLVKLEMKVNLSNSASGTWRLCTFYFFSLSSSPSFPPPSYSYSDKFCHLLPSFSPARLCLSPLLSRWSDIFLLLHWALCTAFWSWLELLDATVTYVVEKGKNLSFSKQSWEEFWRLNSKRRKEMSAYFYYHKAAFEWGTTAEVWRMPELEQSLRYKIQSNRIPRPEKDKSSEGSSKCWMGWGNNHSLISWWKQRWVGWESHR